MLYDLLHAIGTAVAITLGCIIGELIVSAIRKEK